MGCEAGRYKTSTPSDIFIVTPSLDGLPTKAKDAPSPPGSKTGPAGEPSISIFQGMYLLLVIWIAVNIAQSYLMFNFSINCMLPLVILAFPGLLLVYFSFSCCDFSFSCCSSESLCNPRFNSVQLGFFFG